MLDPPDRGTDIGASAFPAAAAAAAFDADAGDAVVCVSPASTADAGVGAVVCAITTIVQSSIVCTFREAAVPRTQKVREGAKQRAR